MFKLFSYVSRRGSSKRTIKIGDKIPVFTSETLARDYMKAMDGRGLSARNTFLAPITRLSKKHQLDPKANKQ